MGRDQRPHHVQQPHRRYPDALPIPSPRSRWEPNAAVYPFWHDWVVDGPGSIRTATIENGDNDKFVVEWRDVSAYYDENVRASFEVIFEQNGTISFAYRGLDGNFMERAGASTIGIENADGSAASSTSTATRRCGPGSAWSSPRPRPDFPTRTRVRKEPRW